MDSVDYRAFHQSLISNNTGTTAEEVFVVTLTIPITALLNLLLLPLFLPSHYWHLQYSSRLWCELFSEFFLINFPVLLAFTIFSNAVPVFFVTLLVTAVTATLPYLLTKPGKVSNELLNTPCWLKKPPYMTNYRAGMLLATSICILAVDFPIFPRKFAKTETYGFGLMDVGVASFVIVSGFATRSPQLKLRKIAPIFLLGLLRLIFVRAFNYHEHVTEYGLHWNFFFTLAITNTLGPLLLKHARPAVLAVAVIAIYQGLLSIGLESWILEDTQRTDFLTANREGICSLLGYLALYWFSIEVGMNLRNTSTGFKHQLKLLTKLSIVCLIGSLSLPFCETVFGKTSRRLANVSYCLWMISFNIGILAACLAVDLFLVTVQYYHDKSERPRISQDTVLFREPYLFRVINFNGLVYFLIANLLTGFINIFFQPMMMSLVQSLIILMFYCIGTCVPVACLYLWKIKI